MSVKDLLATINSFQLREYIKQNDILSHAFALCL